jgi:UDP-N-acetylglucosamine 2-epimerase (non-hydrolysing)/UDP-N-acetylglucosamine 2-epimerase (hydrolysing)
MTTYLSCIGSRAEIIAMASLHRVLRARGDRMLVLHTGPHKAMADLLYRFFDMGPFMSVTGQQDWSCRETGTGVLVDRVAQAIDQAQADVVLVQGDSRPALVGTLAAHQLGRPVAHVEVGVHRRESQTYSDEHGEPHQDIIGRLAHWHFAATEPLRERLLRAGAPQQRVHLVGNPVIDTALWVREHIARPGFDNASAVPPALHRFLVSHPASRLLLVTADGLDAWGQPVRNIASAVGQLLQQQPDLIVVWPVRPGWVVRTELDAVLSRLSAACRDRICLTDPLDYPALIAVLAQCHITLTDAGGNQQEASALARPVLIAGDGNDEGGERAALVQAGGARWVGHDTGRIVDETVRLLTQYTQYRAMQLSASPFGDGQSARRIADILSATA